MNEDKDFGKSLENLPPKLSCAEDDADELDIGNNDEKRDEETEHHCRKRWKLANRFARFIRYIFQGVC